MGISLDLDTDIPSGPGAIVARTIPTYPQVFHPVIPIPPKISIPGAARNAVFYEVSFSHGGNVFTHKLWIFRVRNERYCRRLGAPSVLSALLAPPANARSNALLLDL